MQSEIRAIQGTRGITYAGAWLKYGFHEDGFTAGLRAALGLATDPGSSTSKSTRTPDVRPFIPDVRPPFEVHSAERQVQEVRLLSAAFDLFEGSGMRAFVGSVGCMGLGICGWVLGVNFTDDFGRRGRKKSA